MSSLLVLLPSGARFLSTQGFPVKELGGCLFSLLSGKILGNAAKPSPRIEDRDTEWTRVLPVTNPNPSPMRIPIIPHLRQFPI